MKTLVLGEIVGGTIILTDSVENYPGFIRLTGQDLADKLKEHALDYKENVEIREEKVIEIERESKDGCFIVKTYDGNEYVGKTILITTGTKEKELEVPGNKEFKNKGVSSCALCDGALYKDKIVCVVGGSDSAAKEALVLARYAKKVYVIYRGEQIHPEPPNMKRVQMEKKIEVINLTNVIEIKGDKFVTGVVLDKPYKSKKQLVVDGVFVAIGHILQNDLAKQIGVKLNQKGEIIIDRNSSTNVEGVFAAGDICDTQFKQAITGVGEAVSAIYSAYKYLGEKEIVCA